ncbi:hypothetical protein S40293_10600 [Stachybotrys chartarum IBT 40293]|nr:hypothetical protein S40293_10600 [Stachybotrys chartarum IBT 40293]
MWPHYTERCCATSPFLMYLESIPSFSTEAEHLSGDGIEYLLRNGAQMSLSDIRTGSWEPICGTSIHNLPGVMSPVQLLLSKWRLRTLHQPRFFDTIKLLIQRGNELTRAANIIQDFSHDSYAISTPLQRHCLDHPDHVPQWSSIRLNDPLAWITYGLLDLPNNVVRLLRSKISNQEEKDKLLYGLVVNGKGLKSPQFYRILGRMVIDRLQSIGSDINGFVGRQGETILYKVCCEINNTYVKGMLVEEPISVMKRFRQSKLKDLCESLVDKGADPELKVHGMTALEALEQAACDADEETQRYLRDVSKTILETRKRFLLDGSTSNEQVHRWDEWEGSTLPGVYLQSEGGY